MSLTLKQAIYINLSPHINTLPLYFKKYDSLIKVVKVNDPLVFFKKYTISYSLSKESTNEWEEIHKFIDMYEEYKQTTSKAYINLF